MLEWHRYLFKALQQHIKYQLNWFIWSNLIKAHYSKTENNFPLIWESRNYEMDIDMAIYIIVRIYLINLRMVEEKASNYVTFIMYKPMILL